MVVCSLSRIFPLIDKYCTGSPPPLTEEFICISIPSSLWHTLNVVARIFIDLIISRSPQNDLVRLQPLCPLDGFSAYEDHRKQEDHEIGKEEGWNVPLPRQEYSIPSNKSHDEATGKSIISTKRPPETLMRKRISVKSSSIASSLPSNEREYQQQDYQEQRMLSDDRTQRGTLAA